MNTAVERDNHKFWDLPLDQRDTADADADADAERAAAAAGGGNAIASDRVEATTAAAATPVHASTPTTSIGTPTHGTAIPVARSPARLAEPRKCKRFDPAPADPAPQPYTVNGVAVRTGSHIETVGRRKNVPVAEIKHPQATSFAQRNAAATALADAERNIMIADATDAIFTPEKKVRQGGCCIVM